MRRVLGLLLLALALVQASDLPGFARAVEAYRLGPGIPLAVAVVVAEVVGGAALLDRDRKARRSGAVLAFAVAAAWTIAGLVALARGLDLRNAGWLGTRAEAPLSPLALVVPALAVWVAWRVLRRALPRGPRWGPRWR